MRNKYNEQFEMVVSTSSTTVPLVPEPVEGTITTPVETTEKRYYRKKILQRLLDLFMKGIDYSYYYKE